MAVPPEITVHNLSGVYTLNRQLSDSTQNVLKQQGVNFLVRQVVAHSNVETTLAQYTTDDGARHLDQTQISTGSTKNFEDRIMDWEWTEKYNWIWGKVHGRSRYVKLSEIEDEWLREGWEEACAQGEVVEGFVESMTDTWSAWQVWGFAEIDGMRRQVRRILARKPGWKDERIRVIYDWKAHSS